MKYYLYLGGRLMPEAPTSALISKEGMTSVTELFDGRYHMAVRSENIHSLTVIFPITEGKAPFCDSGFDSTKSVFGYLEAISHKAFECVIIGTDEKGCVLVDINMTVMAEGISAKVRGQTTEVTVKLLRYSGGGIG